MSLYEKILKAAATKPGTAKAAPTWQNDPDVIAAQDAVARAEKALAAALQAASEPAATVAKIDALILDAQTRSQDAIAGDDSAAFDAAVADQRRAEDRLKFDAARAAKFSHALALAQADVDRLKSEACTIESAARQRLFDAAFEATANDVASAICALADTAWQNEFYELDRNALSMMVVGKRYDTAMDGRTVASQVSPQFAERLASAGGDRTDYAQRFNSLVMSFTAAQRGAVLMPEAVRVALHRRGVPISTEPEVIAPIAATARWMNGLVKI
jgi:hypothetical protein